MDNKIIKQMRQTLNLTQADFAKALGVSFSTVSRWEKGEIIPNDKQLEQLDVLKQLQDNKRVDSQKLRDTLRVIGVGGALIAAIAAGVPLVGALAGAIKGHLANKKLSKLIVTNGKDEPEDPS